MILEFTDTVATDTRPAQDEACQTPMMNRGRSLEASSLPGDFFFWSLFIAEEGEVIYFSGVVVTKLL